MPTSLLFLVVILEISNSCHGQLDAPKWYRKAVVHWPYCRTNSPCRMLLTNVSRPRTLSQHRTIPRKMQTILETYQPARCLQAAGAARCVHA